MTPGDIALGIARFGLCLAFIYSGMTKLFNLPAAIAEQVHLGMPLPSLVAVMTIVVQLGGSALVLFGHGRIRASGAVLLATFTAIATPIGHAFWNLQGMDRFHHLNSFLEHAGLIGGFAIVAALAWREQERRR